MNTMPDLSKRSDQIRVRAFTVRELLVVVLMLAVLALTVLPAWLRHSNRVLRARCVSNLRELGVALQTYASEANEFMPVCKFRDTNPWYTYEVMRGFPETGQVAMGYMNLGLLIRTKMMANPQLLYCPAQQADSYLYEHYISSTNGWFADATGMLRAGYNYFPQLQATQNMGFGLTLPRVTITSVTLEFGSLSSSALQSMRYHELNLQKSAVTDLVHNAGIIAHRDRGVVAGVNALFPDGRVTFQSARNNPNNFSPFLWGNISTDGLAFRQVMNGWKP